MHIVYGYISVLFIFILHVIKPGVCWSQPANAWFLNLNFFAVRMYVCMYVCVSVPSLLITNGEIWNP